jgi:hypothetical protein
MSPDMAAGSSSREREDRVATSQDEFGKPARAIGADFHALPLMNALFRFHENTTFLLAHHFAPRAVAIRHVAAAV